MLAGGPSGVFRSQAVTLAQWRRARRLLLDTNPYILADTQPIMLPECICFSFFWGLILGGFCGGEYEGAIVCAGRQLGSRGECRLTLLFTGECWELIQVRLTKIYIQNIPLVYAWLVHRFSGYLIRYSGWFGRKCWNIWSKSWPEFEIAFWTLLECMTLVYIQVSGIRLKDLMNMVSSQIPLHMHLISN